MTSLSRTDLILAATKLHDLTQDPLLLDAIRVLTSKNQPPKLVEQATRCIVACREAHFVLYGTYEPAPDP